MKSWNSRKRIAVLVDNDVSGMEVWYPYYRFIEAGAEVVLVGAKAAVTTSSKLGYPAVSQKSYDDRQRQRFRRHRDFPELRSRHIRRYPKANKLVADMNAQGKLVAVDLPCPWVLCSAHAC